MANLPEIQALFERKEQCYRKIYTKGRVDGDIYTEDYIQQLKMMIAAIDELTKIIYDFFDLPKIQEKITNLEYVAIYLSFFSDTIITDLNNVMLTQMPVKLHNGHRCDVIFTPPGDQGSLGYDLALKVLKDTREYADCCLIDYITSDDGCLILSMFLTGFNSVE